LLVERPPGKHDRRGPPQDTRCDQRILYQLRTGTSWREVLEKYDDWHTIYCYCVTMSAQRLLRRNIGLRDKRITMAAMSVLHTMATPVDNCN
jgi:transposase